MPPRPDIRDDLLEVNRLLANEREHVLEGRRGSIPVGGFTFARSKQRNKSGTDELLQTAVRSAPKLGPVHPKSFDEAYYWENQHLYFPEILDSQEELDETSSTFLRTTAPNCAHTYLCPMPTFGTIGHAEFENLIIGLQAAAKSPDSEILACAALAGITCMTPFNQVHLLVIDGDLVHRTPPGGWESFHDSSNLHLAAKPCITYRPPKFVVRGLAKFQKLHPRSPIPQNKLSALLKEISPFSTIATLQGYLLRVGGDVWGYSPAIPALSYRGIGLRPGVFASYVRGDQIFRSLENLYNLIEPGSGNDLASLPNGFGCAHVPKAEEVRDFATAWHSLFQISLTESPETLRVTHNAIVAGLHLLGCIFLSGTRNYPGAPPVSAEMIGAFYVNREKEHAIPTVWSAFLREGLASYRNFRDRIENPMKLAGRTSPYIFQASYCFWGEQDEPIIVSPTTIASALANCPGLARWDNFHPNAFRALGMTTLYESHFFHTHDIERFFGRSLKSLAPLSAHRLESICPRDLYQRIESYLRQSLGL